MAGAQQKAMTSLRIGLMAIQAALPGLEMGSELQASVLKAVADLSKHVGKSEEGPGGQVQQLAQMAKQAQLDPQKAAMMRAMPAPQPQAPAGGAPPMADAA